MVSLKGRKPLANSVRLIAAISALTLTGCAGSESLQLPQLPVVTTGSLPNPVSVVSEHFGEMAEATGAVQSPARKRLDELYALDKRCYAIAAGDEVWQAYKADRATRAPAVGATEDSPPVSNPWTPENQVFHQEHCTEDARVARHAEMRSLRL